MDSPGQLPGKNSTPERKVQEESSSLLPDNVLSSYEAHVSAVMLNHAQPRSASPSVVCVCVYIGCVLGGEVHVWESLITCPP